MRTTLDMDSNLLDQVVEATGERSKTRAVNKALAEYVRRRRIAELREIAGNIDLVNNLKGARSTRAERDGADALAIVDANIWIH